MTHTYNVTGMTCEGCVAKVKKELQKIAGVEQADVVLATSQATIQTATPIPATVLQQALGQGKYTITEAHAGPMPVATEDTATPSYYPIFLIFGFITVASLMAQIQRGTFEWDRWMSSFMAGFFLLFSLFKFLNLKGFAAGYGSYDIVAKIIPAYGYVYPFMELLLGLAYLTGYAPLATNGVTLVVMGVSSIGVIQSLVRKTQFQCACLGTIIKLPLSKVTLVEDLLMVAMSLAMVLHLIKIF